MLKILMNFFGKGKWIALQPSLKEEVDVFYEEDSPIEIEQKELQKKIEQHQKYINNVFDGERLDLTNIYLHRIDLSGTDLSYANLSGADFYNAILNRANLNRANLRCANLTGADLSYTNLRHADLSYADLTDA